jgi:hypothetical protein
MCLLVFNLYFYVSAMNLGPEIADVEKNVEEIDGHMERLTCVSEHWKLLEKGSFGLAQFPSRVRHLSVGLRSNASDYEEG